MPEPVRVDDPADPRLIPYANLTDAELRRSVEADQGLFVAEGVLVIRRLLASGRGVRSLLVTASRYADLRSDLAGVDDDLPVYVGDLDLLRAVSGFDVHRGALAVGIRWPLPSVEDVTATARTVAVFEAINDLENMGSLFRNAAALGVDAVVLDDRSCDPLSRRALRVSMGHALVLPFARTADLISLGALGFELVALTPRRDAIPIDQFVRPGRVAIAVGAEGPGLSDDLLSGAHHLVRIPMAAGVDSLNVATAAAIAFHLLR